MAKATTTAQSKTAAPAAATDEKALARVKEVSEALATLDTFKADDSRGKEQITSDDVVLPFLAIAQKTSPQIEKGHDKFIDGLDFLDLFNSLTGDIYGTGPVKFVPILLRKHAIEFKPFNEGGGIVDRDVPWDDARCQFNGDEKPTATRFYDWVVLLVPSMELIVLSFKSTNIKAAKQFQQFVNMRSGPAFAGAYTVGVVSAKNQYGTFGKLVVRPAGKPSNEEAEFAASVYENLKDKKIVVEHVADEPGTEQPAGGEAPAEM